MLIYRGYYFQKLICSPQGGIEIDEITYLLCGMYFKVSMRTNPQTGVYSGYYRLVESYRNHQDRVCHRTILNAGYLDDLTPDQLNMIQKILTTKVNQSCKPLFDLSVSDPVVKHYVDLFYNRIVSEKRVDIDKTEAQKAKKGGEDMQLIDINSVRHKDVREIGGEWLSYQALLQLQVGDFLRQHGWAHEETNLALTHIISRAVYPASELCTARWAKENSAVCEVTGYNIDKINKDKLYDISLKLFSEHEVLGKASNAESDYDNFSVSFVLQTVLSKNFSYKD